MGEGEIFVLSIVIPLATIVGGCMLIGLAIYRFTRLKELAMRERLALIEKGLVPSPEQDPARFEQILQGGTPARRAANRGMRMRTTGIILMGVGLGLAVLIAFAGDDVGSGIGVGGGIAIMGLAFLVSGTIAGRQSSWPEYSRPAGTANATEPVGSRPGLEP
jgi:hypothetical protein